MSQESYTLKQAADELELTEFYVRKCLREGKIDGEKELIAGTKIERWVISAEEIDRFANRETAGVGRRDDGRNKFVIYLTPEELEQHEEFLSSVGADFGRANPPKS